MNHIMSCEEEKKTERIIFTAQLSSAQPNHTHIHTHTHLGGKSKVISNDRFCCSGGRSDLATSNKCSTPKTKYKSLLADVIFVPIQFFACNKIRSRCDSYYLSLKIALQWLCPHLATLGDFSKSRRLELLNTPLA